MADDRIKIGIEADGKQADAEVKRVANAVGGLGDAGKKAGKDTDEGLGRAESAAKDYGTSAKRASDDAAGGFRGVKSEITALTVAAGNLIAVGVTKTFGAIKNAAQGLLGSIVSLGRESGEYRKSLELLTGSQEKAASTLDALNKLSRETGTELASNVEAYRTLKNFGLDPLDGTLQAIIDQTAALGGEQERQSRITLALGQAYAKGRLQAEEMLQLVEAGVPVYDLLSQATGRTAREIQDMGKKGLLGRDAIRALISEIGSASEGAAASRLSEFGGIVDRLRQNFTRFLRLIADSGFVKTLGSELDRLNVFFDRNEGKIKAVAKAISETLSKAVRSASELIQRLVKDSGGVEKALDKLASTIGSSFTKAAGVFNTATGVFSSAFHVIQIGFKGMAIAALESARLISQTIAKHPLAKLSGLSEKLNAFAANARGAAETIAEDIKKNIGDLEGASERLKKGWKQLSDQATETGAATKELVITQQEYEESSGAAADSTDRLADAQGRAANAATNQAGAQGEANKAVNDSAEAAAKAEAAFEALGIKSSAALQRQAEDARDAYDEIVKSNAPIEDQARAWGKVAEAELDAAEAAGDVQVKTVTAALLAEAPTAELRDRIQEVSDKLIGAGVAGEQAGRSIAGGMNAAASAASAAGDAVSRVSPSAARSAELDKIDGNRNGSRSIARVIPNLDSLSDAELEDFRQRIYLAEQQNLGNPNASAQGRNFNRLQLDAINREMQRRNRANNRGGTYGGDKTPEGVTYGQGGFGEPIPSEPESNVRKDNELARLAHEARLAGQIDLANQYLEQQAAELRERKGKTINVNFTRPDGTAGQATMLDDEGAEDFLSALEESGSVGGFG